MSCVALTSLTARPRALRAGRGSASRGRVQVAPVRAAASSAVPAAPGVSTKTNPLENIELLDVAGNPAQPWNTDKTVVVSFLRHFG